ncbi:MAG: helix-turn-helix domain-containing protein [Bacilli bacterium]|nr:helix-turn-helix domain-containing protein [Bacilli bacterium]
MIDRPNYYAVIPSIVRYDSDLTANAKLLYGEITALCNEKGYCWASNSYFSKLYGVSDRSIQMLLKQLKDKEYIKIEIIDKQSRKIYIDFTRYEKNFVPPTKKISQGYEKIFTHNNKKNNKIEYEEIKEIKKENFFDYDWLE